MGSEMCIRDRTPPCSVRVRVRSRISRVRVGVRASRVKVTVRFMVLVRGKCRGEEKFRGKCTTFLLRWGTVGN